MDGSIGTTTVTGIITSPAFTVLACVLAAIPAVVALRLTIRILRLPGSVGALSPEDAVGLRSAPEVVLPIETSADDPALVAAVSHALARRGMRVRSGPRIVEANTRSWSAWIVPALLWALALWFVAVAAAGALRTEGTLGLLAGDAVPDAPASYRHRASGFLAGGVTTAVSVRADDVLAGGSSAGVGGAPSALVSLLEADAVVDTQRIWPGHELRHGDATVRMRDVGIAPIYSVESTSGAQVSRVPLLLTYPAAEGSTTVAEEFSLVDGSGKGAFRVRVTVPLESDPTGAAIRQVPLAAESILETAPPGTSAFGAPITLKLGDSIPLPDGQWLRFVSVDDWALVTLTRDQVPPLAWPLAAFVIVLALLAALIAPRRVLVGIVGSGDDRAVHVIVNHARGDAAFAERLRAEIAEAVRDTARASGGRFADDGTLG